MCFCRAEAECVIKRGRQEPTGESVGRGAIICYISEKLSLFELKRTHAVWNGYKCEGAQCLDINGLDEDGREREGDAGPTRIDKK